MDQQTAPANYEVGYKKPPKKTQFVKGQSGNPDGRPKRSNAINMRDLFSGTQQGKNGAVISSREAFVIRLLNDALSGKQKAFARFLKLMMESGLLQQEQPPHAGIIRFPTDPAQSPSPKTYAVWLRANGRHDEADGIDPRP